MSFLHFVNHKPDILAMTETRLSTRTVINVDILNYDFFHTYSPTQTNITFILVKFIYFIFYETILKVT